MLWNIFISNVSSMCSRNIPYYDKKWLYSINLLNKNHNVFHFSCSRQSVQMKKKNWGNSYKKNNYPGQVLCSSSRDMDALVEPNLKAAYWVDLKKKMCMKMNLRTNTFIYDWVILQNNYAWYFSRYNVFTFIYFLKIFNVFSFIFKQVQWS